MIELKKELNEINRKLAYIILSPSKLNKTILEKNLWARKRKILAKLNPINL